jgi:hypothetical protein
MIVLFTNKRVPGLNEKIEPGVVMNALAHMCLGFGAEMSAKHGYAECLTMNLSKSCDGL